MMGGVKLEAAFLANHAEVHDGLAFVTGGFPEWWSVPATNTFQQVALVVVARLDRNEVGQTFTYEIIIERPDGTQQPVVYVASSRGQSPHSEAQPLLLLVPIAFSIDFRQLGLHRFLVNYEGETLGDVPFEVRLAVPKPPDAAKAQPTP
jgi:hypothetical protein